MSLRIRFGFLLSLSNALFAPAAHAQVPAGPPFQVNTSTTLDQERSAVAAFPRGGYVVVWHSDFGSAIAGHEASAITAPTRGLGLTDPRPPSAISSALRRCAESVSVLVADIAALSLTCLWRPIDWSVSQSSAH
jgi:hypothetical protein